MALEDTHPTKRTSTQANFDIPFAKKRNRGIHHHKSAWDLQRSVRLAAPGPDEENIQALLTRSIALALEVAGFMGAEPMAMESFRAAIEECTTHFTMRGLKAEFLTRCARYETVSSRRATFYDLLSPNATHTAGFCTCPLYPTSFATLSRPSPSFTSFAS